jgi:hypothetical protein
MITNKKIREAIFKTYGFARCGGATAEEVADYMESLIPSLSLYDTRKNKTAEEILDQLENDNENHSK